MARPVKANAAATRNRILFSALQMFSDSGLDGVSIRKIAKSADVSLAMVHHYFGSKDELYSACIDTMYDQMIELRPKLTASLAVGGTVEELAGRMVADAFRFARNHQTAGRLLMRQVVGAGELDKKRQDAMQLPFLEQATALLSAMTGRPAVELRLPLQTVTFAVARYGLSTQAGLEMFSGQTGDDAVQAVEDHLIATAIALLSPAKRNDS